MFWPAVAIIRSLSIDTLKSTLQSCGGLFYEEISTSRPFLSMIYLYNQCGLLHTVFICWDFVLFRGMACVGVEG